MGYLYAKLLASQMQTGLDASSLIYKVRRVLSRKDQDSNDQY